MNTRPMALITSTSMPFLRFEQPGAAAGRAGREIDRADEPLLASDEHQRVLLVEGVIAERDRIGTGVQISSTWMAFGDAEAAGRVLGVDDQEVELVALSAGDGSISTTALRPARPTTSPRKRRRLIERG